MIKTKDTAADLLKEAEKILEKIEKIITPSLQFQNDLKNILLKLKQYSLQKKKSVLAQQIQRVINEFSKTTLPSLFLQKESAKEAIILFVVNFKKSSS